MKITLRNLFVLAFLTLIGQFSFGQLSPNPVLTFMPTSPCSNLPVQFTITDLNGVYSGYLMNVNWDFGDGSTQSWFALSNQHTYAPGSYLACAYVYDSTLGQVDTVCVFLTVSGGCPPPDVFNGVVYFDLNNNGTRDVNEPGDSYATVQVAPNGYVFTADINGNFSIPLAPGSYTLSSPPQTHYTTTQPTGGNYPIISNGTGAITNNLNFGQVAIPGQQDMRVVIVNRPHVPGFFQDIWGGVENVGTQAQSGTASITLDPNVTFNYAFSSGSYSAGVFSFPYSLPPNGVANFHFNITPSPSLQIGNTVTYTAIVNPLVGDLNPLNNYATMTAPVLSSYDPNDKAVEAIGMGPNGEINAGDELTYTVRFQNEGNFPATFIYIRDTLDPNLDWSSFRVILSSHQMTHTQTNDQIQFYFDNIQLVPKSVDEQASQGFVVYKIKSKASLLPGDEMRNTASIYFDYNPAVVTNTTLNSVWIPTALEDEMNPMEIVLFPNPMAERATLRFDAGGESWDLKVTDLQGRTVMERMHETMGYIEIHRGDLAAGTYLFQLVSDAGKMATGKMIVE